MNTEPSLPKETSPRKRTKLQQLSAQLVEDGWRQNIDEKLAFPNHAELAAFQKFADKHHFQGSEGWFLPENREYSRVLNRVEPQDVILDVGAGNFALDLLLAERCKKVYAVEVNPRTVADALRIIGYDQPRNLIIVCANGLDFPIPKDVNHLVMLLRHFSQPLPNAYLELPKITAQIYGQWVLVPEDI